MNIFMGGLFEGIIWDSGALSNILMQDKNIDLTVSGASSLIGFFYGMHGKNFYKYLKEFIEEKDNPIKPLIDSDLFSSRYKQAVTLLKLGTSGLELKNQTAFSKYLDSRFGTLSIEKLKHRVDFEVFDIKTGNFFLLDRKTRISQVLLSELSILPYYKFCEVSDMFLIPSSYICLSPYNLSPDGLIISYEAGGSIPKAMNAAEILLKISYARTRELFRIISKDNDLITCENELKDPLDSIAFYDGMKTCQKYMEGKLEL
ncbi:MAG TPA: hypothetical protein PKH64_05665 [Petrotogaceae bacterium]|jgi:hypothetical protein|nr:hypothetical protein [Petrotogaceae bacterium]